MDRITTFSERLAFFITRKSWKAARLAREIDVKDATIHKYLAGDMTPGGETLGKICDSLGLSDEDRFCLWFRWLTAKAKDESEKKFIESMKLCMSSPETQKRQETYKFPVWAGIRNGAIAPNYGTAEEVSSMTVTAEDAQNGIFLVRMEGDSIRERRLAVGDIAAFEAPERHHILDGDVVIAEVEGLQFWVIKKIRRGSKPGIFVLEGDNDPPTRVDGTTTSMSIKGVLVWSRIQQKARVL